MDSPFSLKHKWSLFWNRLPSNLRPMELIQCDSKREQKALHAIANIGVIGGRQLFHLFSIDKKRLKKMEREQKVVRHVIKKGNQIIPIFTLGPTGSIITKHTAYEPNYWVEYHVEDVLKRLLYFRLYQFFPEASIVPTTEPFVGGMDIKGNPLYVYVVRGDTSDLLNYLKWRGNTFNGRLIIIAEDFKHIQPLVMYTKDIKMRLTSDNDLMQANSMRELFYFMSKEGEFIKEAQ